MTFLETFYQQGIERCLALGFWPLFSSEPAAGKPTPPSFFDSALLATSCRGLTLFDVILIAVAVLTIAKLTAWLLTEAVKLIARYFTLALSGRIKPRQVLSTCLFISMAVFAGHLGYFSADPDERYAMFVATAGAVVALLLVMWIETRERPFVLTAQRPKGALAKAFPPKKTTTPNIDAPLTSIHDDWNDIAQQVKAENANALTVTETKPMRVGESREALAAYLGNPNDNPEGDKN